MMCSFCLDRPLYQCNNKDKRTRNKYGSAVADHLPSACQMDDGMVHKQLKTLTSHNFPRPASQQLPASEKAKRISTWRPKHRRTRPHPLPRLWVDSTAPSHPPGPVHRPPAVRPMRPSASSDSPCATWNRPRRAIHHGHKDH